MAKSLKCGQCGALLASFKEAQAHNEATGHTEFEETTEVIKVQKCVACGKPCRTDAERGLHTRFTGHTEYVETTFDEALNTEAQMQAARAEMEEDDELVAGLVKKKKKPSTPGATEGATEGAAAAAAEGGDGGQPSSSDAGASSSGQEMVSPEVDAGLVSELEAMGFGHHRAVRAVYHSGGAGVEAAVNWVMEHESDADIDTPLLVTKASEEAAAKLTPEERKRKAAELIRAAKEKREREERELAAHRERERIRAGKELLAAKKKEDELALRRNIEARQREKEEAAAARAKIQARLDEDRRERRRKLGLPEELTEEEKARAAQKAAEKAAQEAEAAKKKVFAHVRPISTIERLRTLLVGMKKAHVSEEERWRTAATTLSKYVANICANPDEEKFRNIKTSNAAFQQRVAGLTGSLDFLQACGFQLEGEVLVLARDKVDMDVLNGALSALSDMLQNPFFGAL